jgi:yecA family protein
MTRYEAFIEKSWRESGIAQLLVARIRDDGRADIGFFLVDLWCLGIKDAFLVDDGSEAHFREILTDRLPEDFRERLHPACAKKMIEGALAYAESFGFAPHRDYRKARRALSGLDAAACPETFTFGRDGKPCFVEGPHDTPERTERVLAILEARCGPDGFGYESAEDVVDLDADREDARGALRMFFEELEGDAPDFYEFAGLVAALQICPTVVLPTQLLSRLFDPANHTWRDEDELKDFASDLIVYWNEIADLMARCASTSPGDDTTDAIDAFDDDFDEPDETLRTKYLGMALIQWCRGFMRATREWPEVWGDALTRADLAPHWALLGAWADPEKPESMTILRDRAHDRSTGPSRRLPEAVLALTRALRPRRFTAVG